MEDVSVEYLQEVIEYRCPNEMAADLVRPVQGEEIKKIIFSMPSNKAPGPDGYPVELYKAAWPVVGKDDIESMCSAFLWSGTPNDSKKQRWLGKRCVLR